MDTNKSEVARFREQQTLEEESVSLVSSGYAITARHDFITARAQRGAERILYLIATGREAEALILMNAPDWDKQQRYSKQRKKVASGKGAHKIIMPLEEMHWKNSRSGINVFSAQYL